MALRRSVVAAVLAATSVEAADFRASRDRMVREQIESRGVTNALVLAAMRKGNARKAEELRRLNIRSSREYLERFQSFVL